ncbi:MAG: hypothetical protein ACE5HT_16905, partial [Gemmatimonadales bacterium]
MRISKSTLAMLALASGMFLAGLINVALGQMRPTFPTPQSLNINAPSAATGPVVPPGEQSVGPLIDFDDVTVTGGFQFFPPDQYRAQGVVFDASIPIEAVEVAEPSWFPTFVAQGGTAPNALSLTTAPVLVFVIETSFVLPGTNTPGVTDFVQ